MAVGGVWIPVERDPAKLTRSRRLSPNEKQADVARHPVGKVNNPRRKMETLRLQIMAPSQIDLGGFATQRRRPAWVGYVNSTAAVAAYLAWKAQEQEFLQPLFGRGARFMKEMAPASVRDMLADQLLRPVLLLLPAL